MKIKNNKVEFDNSLGEILVTVVSENEIASSIVDDQYQYDIEIEYESCMKQQMRLEKLENDATQKIWFCNKFFM